MATLQIERFRKVKIGGNSAVITDAYCFYVFDRKPEKDEKISKEAAKVISLLPDLSFMQARVLMFPSVLTPAANQI